MTILEALASLGFTDATVCGSRNNKTCVRVMTNKGWVYEWFASADEVPGWAQGRLP